MEPEQRNKLGKLKKHQFYVTDAIKCGGIEEAVILFHIRFWLGKAKDNPDKFGTVREYKNNKYYWFEATHDKFAEKFPYINKRKIGDILRALERREAILSAYFEQDYGYKEKVKHFTIPELYLIK